MMSTRLSATLARRLLLICPLLVVSRTSPVHSHDKAAALEHGSIERVMIYKVPDVFGYGGFLGIGDDHYPTPCRV